MNKNLTNNKTTGQPDNLDIIPEPTHPSVRSKIVNRLVVVALIVVALGLGVILKWSFVDENILEVKNSPFPVRTIREHPTANGVVLLNVDMCKYTDIEGSVRTSFVSDSREIFLPLSRENIPKGCFNREIPVIIPKDIVADTYKIKFRVTYDLNPLKREISDQFESKEFVVDPQTP